MISNTSIVGYVNGKEMLRQLEAARGLLHEFRFVLSARHHQICTCLQSQPNFALKLEISMRNKKQNCQTLGKVKFDPFPPTYKLRLNFEKPPSLLKSSFSKM